MEARLFCRTETNLRSAKETGLRRKHVSENSTRVKGGIISHFRLQSARVTAHKAIVFPYPRFCMKKLYDLLREVQSVSFGKFYESLKLYVSFAGGRYNLHFYYEFIP